MDCIDRSKDSVAQEGCDAQVAPLTLAEQKRLVFRAAAQIIDIGSPNRDDETDLDRVMLMQAVNSVDWEVCADAHQCKDAQVSAAVSLVRAWEQVIHWGCELDRRREAGGDCPQAEEAESVFRASAVYYAQSFKPRF